MNDFLVYAHPKDYTGHTYDKKVFSFYLKFNFNWHHPVFYLETLLKTAGI